MSLRDWISRFKTPEAPPPEKGGTVLRAPSALAATPPPTKGASPQAPSFSPGNTIAETFLIKETLGQGGMGSVYLAHHPGWQIDLALKVPHPEILTDEEHYHRITREAEAWTDLGLHPNITYCYYVHPLGDIPMIVIEYLDGGNLRSWISSGRCTDLRVGLDLAIQFCHGLEHAHGRGMVHRDIKPENVLLTQEGQLKLTDFGIARVGEALSVLSTHAIGVPEGVEALAAASGAALTVGAMGTYEYMAPEQFADAHGVDARADVFAFGVCLYEMLCGRRPYAMAVGARQEAPDPSVLRGDAALPERLCSLMQRCVAWDREERPERAQQIREELCWVYEEVFGQVNAYAELPSLSLRADELNNRGMSYLSLSREEEAERCWEEALSVDGGHLEAMFNLGYRRLEQGKTTYEGVLRQLGDLEGEQSGNDRYWRCVGWLRYEQGDMAGVETLQDSGHRVEDGAFLEALAHPLVSHVRTFEGHTGEVTSVSFSPDGRYVLSGGYDHTVRLWEVETGREVRTFKGHTKGVHSVCFSPDGRYVLSARFGKTLHLWEVETGQELRTFQGHTSSVWSVRFSPDGRHVLSGSLDKTLRLWEVETGREVHTFEGHTDRVLSVRFSPDGRHALSGSDDNTLRLWELDWKWTFDTKEP